MRRGGATYPNLELNPFILAEDGFDFEVDADSGDEGRGERVVGVAEQERRLAHAAVADDQQFEHVVEILIGRILLPPVILAD